MDRAVKPIDIRAAALGFLAACAASAWLGAYFDLTDAGASAALLACWMLFLSALSLRPTWRETAACAVLAAFFSAMRVLGYSYDRFDSYVQVFKNGATLLRSGLAFGALAVAALCALLLLLRLLDGAARAARCAEEAKGFDARLFLLCAGVIFIGSVPYLALYAPGLNIYDTHDQILQFFGFPSYIGDGSVLSDHHPMLLTLVYGGFMRLGLFLGDANAGQMLYSVLSMAVMACCYALALTELRQWGLRRGAVLAIAAFVALYPVLALYAFNMCKDVSAEPFVLLLVFFLLRMERTQGGAIRSRAFACGLCLTMLMLMLTRKSAFYALAFAFPFYLLRYPGVRRRLTAVALLAAALFVGYASALLPALGVVPGETREMLSIPFQQTARVLLEYPQDVTEEEYAAVARVLDVGQVQSYDPRLSDPIKDTSNPAMTGGDLAAYAKAWLRMGLRHPGAYVDAWLNMVYGYFYPSDSNTIVCLTLNSPDRGGVTLAQNPALEGARLSLHNLIYYTLRRLPGVGALFYVDTVTWVFLFLLLALLLHGGRGALWPHMFLVGTAGICMLSPKSGEIRYLLPVLYALPLLFGQALALRGKGDALEKR